MDKCKYCQSTNLVLESRIPGQDVLTANQVALRCGDCGKWLKWCPKDERQRYIGEKPPKTSKQDKKTLQSLILIDKADRVDLLEKELEKTLLELQGENRALECAYEKIKKLESKQIDKDLFEALKEHDRKIEERVLFDVLGILYFQDYNRACDYDKMTGAEVVEAQHKILKEIQERYSYDFDRDFRP